MDCLVRNEAGTIHYGHNRDYHGLSSEEEVIQLSKTGNLVHRAIYGRLRDLRGWDDRKVAYPIIPAKSSRKGQAAPGASSPNAMARAGLAQE